jgi:hypothetical protein
LERAEAVAQGSGVVVAEALGRCVEEAGERVDEGAGLVQVLVLGEVLGQAEVDGGGAHQVQGRGRDDLHARYLGDVAGHGRHRVHPGPLTILRGGLVESWFRRSGDLVGHAVTLARRPTRSSGDP